MNRSFIVAAVLSLSLPLLAAPDRIQPDPVYPEIAKRVVNQLSTTHLSGEVFDSHLSAIAWTNLVNTVDADHSLLTQADLKRFEPAKTTIDQMLRKGDLSFGYDLIQVVRERMEERVAFITDLLKQEKPFDFTTDDTFEWRRSKAERPANREEQKKLWYNIAKNEYLATELMKQLDAEDPKPKKEQAASTYSIKENLDAPVSEIIAKRLRTLRDAYLEMDTETVLQRYLSAVANAYDPHTDYMSPLNFEDFNMDMNLKLYGIGATLRYEDGMIRIMEIMPGSPADMDTRETRLCPGDRVIGVGQGDGPIENIIHKPLVRSIRKIRGAKGTKVVLKVIPFSDKSETQTKLVDLIRDEIKLDEQAVTGRVETLSMPTGAAYKLGYVRIPGFYADVSATPFFAQDSRTMSKDLLAYLRDFNLQHVDGLLIDLRNNGGGSLQEALNMNGLFVTGPVVQVKDKRTVQVLPTSAQVAFRKPIVVLVNRTSASASEIVAGSLQDYGRAIIVGDSKTHGKGTVQTVCTLGNNKLYGAERITTAGFYRINGQSTQLRGVIPDIVLPSIFDALDIGEDQFENAFPYDTVDRAYYAKTDDIARYLPALKERSNSRLAQDEQYQKSQSLIAHLRKSNAEKYLPLNKDKRLQQMEADRALQNLEDEQLAMPVSKNRKDATMENDPVLREAAHILADFIELRGGTDAPVTTNGDIGSQLFRIFGR